MTLKPRVSKAFHLSTCFFTRAKIYSGYQPEPHVHWMEADKKPILRNDDEKVPVASAILASLRHSKRVARLFHDHRHYRREDFARPRKFPIPHNDIERNESLILVGARTALTQIAHLQAYTNPITSVSMESREPVGLFNKYLDVLKAGNHRTEIVRPPQSMRDFILKKVNN